MTISWTKFREIMTGTPYDEMKPSVLHHPFEGRVIEAGPGWFALAVGAKTYKMVMEDDADLAAVVAEFYNREDPENEMDHDVIVGEKVLWDPTEGWTI
jgi:hypothetical protein